MKIAILGSVALPVPPPYQGGTEWIAYYQAEGLVKRGHSVLLFGAKGSAKGPYELIEAGKGDTVAGSSSTNSSLARSHLARLTESSRNLRKENIYLSQVIQQLIDRKNDYDLILNNMRGEAVLLPVAKLLNKPFVNVMHLPVFAELAEIFGVYHTHIITISNAQRKDFPNLNYLATVYNCVDTQKYTFNKKPKEYLLMMGSIAPHKNQAAAIRIAKKAGLPLILAGKIGDQSYYDELKPDIDGEHIQWMGELPFAEKVKLYQDARAFLFPINWPEPFGLVMIEAMSCGTPVVAYANGAIPEVVVDGKTGFVIERNSEKMMVEAVENIGSIRREDCRKHVEEKFSVEKMVESYERALLSLGA